MNTSKIQRPTAPGGSEQRLPSAEGEVLLDEHDLAKRWKLKSPKKLQADRQKGRGPPWIRIGRCVRYRLSDVLAYEEANRHTSTSDG